MSFQYRNIAPLNNTTNYSPGENISFSINENGHSIWGKSFYLSGTLVTTNSSKTPIAITDQQIYYDGQIGMHGAIYRISTTSTKFGNLESMSNYPTCVKAVTQGNYHPSQLGSDAEHTRELKTGDDVITQLILKGEYSGVSGGVEISEGRNSFTVHPMFCLNGFNAPTPINGTALGNITIDIQLVGISGTDKFLFGSGLGTNSWKLENVRLNYQVIPAIIDIPELSFYTIQTFVKQCSIATQLEVRSDLSVFSVSTVFRKPQVATGDNPYKLQVFPVQRLDINVYPSQLGGGVVPEFGSLPSPLQATLTYREDILYHGALSLSRGTFKESGMIYDRSGQQDGFALGYYIGNLIKISNNPILITITGSQTMTDAQDYTSYTLIQGVRSFKY